MSGRAGLALSCLLPSRAPSPCSAWETHRWGDEEWGASGEEKGGLLKTHDFLEPSTPPLLCPIPNPPLCGLATSGSNYQPGRPDLIGTFQISEEEGGGGGGGGPESLELTNQSSFPLVLGVLPIL